VPVSEPQQFEAVPPLESPVSGFTVPPAMYTAHEPLISPDFNGWWSRGIAVVKAGWRPILLVQLGGGLVSLVFSATVVLIQLHSVPSAVLTPTPGAPPPDPGQVLQPLLSQLGLFLGAAALTAFVSLLVTLMTVHLVVQVASGRRAQFGPALRAALPRILPLLGWSSLAGLILFGGVCACILPVFYFLAVFTVLAPVVMFERGGAVGRCFRLFHGDLGASLGRIATIVGLGIGVAVVESVINGGLLAATGGATADLSTRVAVPLVSAVIGAGLNGGLGVLTAPLTVLTYADQRARIEPVRSADLIRELGLGPDDDQRSATVPA
jgi:hypothetical protein